MKRILFSLMAVVLCLGLMGGAFAYFSDVETSEDNTFTAGTIDLAVNDENPWEGSWEFTDIKPCEDLDPMTAKFENVGNNEGVLTFGFDYGEKDKYTEPEPIQEEFEFTSLNNASMELTGDQFAAILYVAAVTYEYACPAEGYQGSVHDDLPTWLAMDLNKDGKVSMYELRLSSPIPYDPTGAPFPATASVEYIVTFHLADSLADWGNVDSAVVTGVEDNRPQADGIEMTFTAWLDQVP